MKTESRLTPTLRSSLHAASAGLSFALLLIGAVGLFNPIETSLFWGQSALGTVNITFYLTVLLGYAAFLVFPRKTLKLKQAADLLLALSLIVLLSIAYATMGTRQEAWFLAFNWLLVHHGWSFGLTLGLAIVSLMGTLSIAGVGARHARARGAEIPAILSYFALFSSVFFALWRYSDVFTLVAALAGAAVLLAFFGALVRPSVTVTAHYESLSRRIEKPALLRLIPVGIFVLLFAGIGVFGLVNKTEIIFYPGAPLPATVRPFQIAAIAAAFACLILFAYLSKADTKALRSEIAIEKGYCCKKKNFLSGDFFHVLQAIGLLFGFATVFYYFPIVLRLPDFLPKIALFVLLGGFVYTLAVHIARRQRDRAAWVLKLLALGLFAAVLTLLVRDSQQNGVQYDGYVTGAPYFPFVFIHGWGHAALAGLSLGLFLADALYTRVFRVQAHDASPARFAGVGLWIFALGITLVGIPHALTLLNGQGEWPPTWSFDVPIGEGIPFGEFFPWAFGGLLALGVLGNLLGSLWLWKPSREELDTAPVNVTSEAQAPTKRRGWRLALSVLLIVCLCLGSLFLGGFMWLYGNSFERHNVATAGAQIVQASAYERVSPTARIQVQEASAEGADNYHAQVRVGGNEYGSVQLVWKTGESPVENLRGTVQFRSTKDPEGKLFNTVELRLAQNLYDDAYPEILVPLDGQTLPVQRNSTLWLSFFTDEKIGRSDYIAILDFTYTVDGEAKTEQVLVDVQVDPYTLPKDTRVLYNLPYEENSYTTAYYAKRRQYMDGGRLTDNLTSRARWYDETQKKWDFSRAVDPDFAAEIKANWDIDVKTGNDVWEAFAKVATHLIVDLGQPMVRADYLTVLVRGDSGIGNPENWTDGQWTGKAWDAYERQIVYDFYKIFNEKLLAHALPDGNPLASRIVIKWKDEFEQPQFFPSNPDGRTLEREELYKIYALELSAMNAARSEAVLAQYKVMPPVGSMSYYRLTKKMATQGIRYLANCDPTGENFDILFDYFDIYCPLSYRITDALVEKCRDAGKRIWQYTCCQPFLPYANQFAYNQTLETHITQWMNYKYDLEGYWLWRSDYKNPAVFYHGFNGWLDGVFVYYPDGEKAAQIGAGDFYTGIRFEVATEAIEETELFYLYEQTLRDLCVAGKIDEYAQARFIAELRAYVDEIIQSPYLFSTEERYIVTFVRERLTNCLTIGYPYDNSSD
jgi:hypothetical protein